MPTAHTDAHWATYNDAQAGGQVRPLCAEVIARAGDGAGRTAIDFGCGAGVETRALLRAGWHVHAIDAAPGTRQRVLTTTEVSDPTRLTIQVSDFHDLVELPAADLVYAGYSLHFVQPRDFPRVWTLLRASLLPGAWLAVNLLGERDSWAADPDMTFLSEASARALLRGLDLVSFTEEDEDGPAHSGPKHWHVFDVIARRPLPKT